MTAEEAREPKRNHKKRVAKCAKCGKPHDIDNPIEWTYANVILKEVICDCGNNTFQIFEVCNTFKDRGYM